MQVGILTGGGDCPGLNAVIRAVVRRAEEHGDTVLGIRDGWKGLIEDTTRILDVEACRGILIRGGTILGTTRYQPFAFEGGVDACRRTFERHNLSALIAVGGDGTLAVADRMVKEGFPIVGVPKTIDNDIKGTERTFGFDTAVQTATEAIDRLHSTAESHDRVMVVEVMGRHVGHIAAWAGIAGGASAILVPEEPFDIKDICQIITRKHHEGRFATIVVVAEGALPIPGTMDIPEPEFNEFGQIKHGGIAYEVAKELERGTGFETRVTVLGHIQRGGTPTATDRVLSTRFGVAAMDAVIDQDFGAMVALESDRIVRKRLSDCVGELKVVDNDLLRVARVFTN
ncbi:MAG: 6-phosphofructokinase [Acidimicrobiia bacterium]|nr:6-phosphofructokinase [Acidimicrobiia bacterium]NND12720.1 6-phosphofructokinase [Acidimicrobiia bacterium]NNL47279.1 6-phosphofructokinase [Acidimicrobiia bacterium]